MNLPQTGIQPTPLPDHRADTLALFLQLLPAHVLDGFDLQQPPPRRHNRVYTPGVVMWLMISQRLQADGTLQSAVLELLRGLPASFWPHPCLRLQPRPESAVPRLSSHTGAYNKARQQLPLQLVEQSLDHVLEKLTAQFQGLLPAGRRPAFFLDGTSIRMPYTPALAKRYPPASNQHGKTHWPLLRMLVAHDLYTGLGMRPHWGPINGAQAVSEQGLFEQALERLPPESVIVGDANFGVFSVAYTATQKGHPVVLRLSKQRALRLAGGPLLDGMDRQIRWQPTRDDRRNHPDLPPDAFVSGRLIVRQVQPSNGAPPLLLALFTTLNLPSEQSVEFYGYRWHIETDLRHLKTSLRLETLTCTTSEMVAKEIDMALMTYNLVRAVTCLAAQQAGVSPREFSFARVRQVVNAFGPLLATATDERQAQKLWQTMMHYVGQARLPKRNNKRTSYPRAVWGRPQTFPKRKG